MQQQHKNKSSTLHYLKLPKRAESLKVLTGWFPNILMETIYRLVKTLLNVKI